MLNKMPNNFNKMYRDVGVNLFVCMYMPQKHGVVDSTPMLITNCSTRRNYETKHVLLYVISSVP